MLAPPQPLWRLVLASNAVVGGQLLAHGFSRADPWTAVLGLLLLGVLAAGVLAKRRSTRGAEVVLLVRSRRNRELFALHPLRADEVAEVDGRGTFTVRARALEPIGPEQ